MKSQCEHCGSNIEFDEELTGQRTRCPHCDTETRLRGEKSIAAAPAKPASRWSTVMLGVITVLLAALVWQNYSAANPKWQYMILRGTSPSDGVRFDVGSTFTMDKAQIAGFAIEDPIPLYVILEYLGADGWELVSFYTIPKEESPFGHETIDVRILVKRKS